MHVGRLIAMLEAFEPDAHVYIMSQPHWPFEYEIERLVARGEFSGEDDAPLREGMREDDVFIVEGEQLRYGSKAAWRRE